MRWWLALAFAAVAAITAAAVVGVLDSRSERAFRSYGEELAIGNAVAAAQALSNDRTPAQLRREVTVLSTRAHTAFFAFSADGNLLSAQSSFGASLRSVPDRRAALQTAIAGNRFITGRHDGSAFVVGLRIHGGMAAALVAYSLRPELSAEFGIVHSELLDGALIALAVGAAAGLLIATLIARRLSRLAHAARAIGAGEFSAAVADRFPDEVGSLASSIEQMRAQIAALVQNLRFDRDRLEQLLDRLNDAVLLIDENLRVEFANSRAQTLLDSAEPLAGRSLDEIPAATPLHVVAAGLFLGEAVRQLQFSTDAGRVLFASGIPPSTAGEAGILVLADETERERNERAQREFVTNASHELRTPLAAIVTATEMLQTGAKHDPGARDDFLDIIEQQSNRLTRLTRALLTLARAEAHEEPPRLTAIPVLPVLEHVVSSLHPHEGVAVTLTCPPALVAVTNEELLEQALTSLAANAAQQTRKGSVSLICSHLSTGQIALEVTDTGHGIDTGKQARVFDRFYRANSQGSGFGLGLAIARNAVHALGGQITLTSTPETGTTVRILLSDP